MATQTCDRTISGRNFDYANALRIIQEEDYLEDEDIDNIRFYRKHGNILEAIEKAEENYASNSLDDEIHHRSRRSAKEKLPLTQSNTVPRKRVKRQTCCLDPPGSEPGAPCNMFGPCPTVPPFVPVEQPSSNPSPSSFPEDNPGLIPAIVLSIVGLTLLMNPSPTNVPSNATQPGSPGGGAQPSGSENILALVPAGLTAVSVFPPFLTPRRVPAEAVIFKETEGTLPGTFLPPVLRKKSQTGHCEPPNWLDRFLLNVRCLGPRLKTRFGSRPDPLHYGYGKKERDTGFYGYYEPDCNELCGTVEDCFDLPCPRYGFAVRYTFTRNIQENGTEYTDDIRARQTGEGFRSAETPDCRITTGFL